MYKVSAADGSLRWTINPKDVLVATCPEWDDFARANSGEEVVTARVLGRSIRSFLSDPTTRHVYEQVFAIVRRGRRFSLPFRCDSPRERPRPGRSTAATDRAGGARRGSAPALGAACAASARL